MITFPFQQTFDAVLFRCSESQLYSNSSSEEAAITVHYMTQKKAESNRNILINKWTRTNNPNEKARLQLKFLGHIFSSQTRLNEMPSGQRPLKDPKDWHLGSGFALH